MEPRQKDMEICILPLGWVNGYYLPSIIKEKGSFHGPDSYNILSPESYVNWVKLRYSPTPEEIKQECTKWGEEAKQKYIKRRVCVYPFVDVADGKIVKGETAIANQSILFLLYHAIYNGIMTAQKVVLKNEDIRREVSNNPHLYEGALKNKGKTIEDLIDVIESVDLEPTLYDSFHESDVNCIVREAIEFIASIEARQD